MSERLTDLLEYTAKKFGSRRAVTMDGKSLSYEELLARAKRIGSFLGSHLSAGSPIPIYMEKSPDTVACLFGALYAGNFYAPISKEQPIERVEKILETLRTRAVVTDEDGKAILEEKGFPGQIFLIGEMIKAEIDEDLLRAIRLDVKPTLCYVMFTSGSTGTPKGVAVSQQAVLDFIGHFVHVTGITEKDVIGNQAPFDFDVSVKDIYSAVSSGAELVLIRKELFAEPPRLMDYLIENNVTTLIWAVPALCILSGMKVFQYRVPTKLRKVMFSGQAMPVRQLLIWKAALPETEFINLYGPTEITCNCTYFRIPRKIDSSFKIPLGDPFPGRQIFLLDPDDHLVEEPGVLGQICVAGESLADGYYRNLEETSRNFTEYEGKRIYKTGDLAMMADDGELYFAGRSDFQVKIMGHRIELEGVEEVILSIGGVDSCCCTYSRDKGRVTAFITGEAEEKAVKAALKEKLPAYMIPAHIRKLPALPLNLNGKIDRRELELLAG